MRPHLYKRPCPSVPNAFVKIDENGPLQIVNDLDSAGRGGRRDEEERGTRRKERRGGRSDEESEKMKNL